MNINSDMFRSYCRLQGDYLAKLLAKSLTDKNPQLDLWGIDRKVLLVSYQDLINYLRFHWKTSYDIPAELELREKLFNCIREKPAELKEFVDFWSGLWMKKWIERVKLLIGKDRSMKWIRIRALLDKAEPIWRRLENRKEMKDLVIEALIRNGEICGTSILAENLLKIELGLSVERKINVDDRENLFRIVNRVLREVKEISRSKGPLILLRIDKNFFHFP